MRAAVRSEIPVSVALGELSEWPTDLAVDFAGLTFRKLGFAGAGPRWVEDWARLRGRLGAGPAWVAVVYADWERAESPSPTTVLDVALAMEDCAGVLFDTFDKSRPSPIDESWQPFFERVRRAGRFSVLAGRIDASTLSKLSNLAPDLVAVRGAACVNGDRLAAVDTARVAALSRAVNGGTEILAHPFLSGRNVPIDADP